MTSLLDHVGQTTTAGVFLAHAGAGSTWQAAVVIAAIVLAVCVGLGALGRLPMNTPQDLLLPIAAAAIFASVGPLGHTWISEGIGWAVPLAIVSLLTLAVGVLTPLDLTPSSPLFLGSVALAVVTSVLLYAPLTVALHPPPEVLPLADDSEVTIVSPADGATVDAGPVDVTVEVHGGSIGPVLTPLEELPADPEEAGSLSVFVDGDRVPVGWDEGCTIEDPCRTVDLEVELTDGQQTLTVEFTRGDGQPLAPSVVDRVTITAR